MFLPRLFAALFKVMGRVGGVFGETYNQNEISPKVIALELISFTTCKGDSYGI
jgi:hypothetical protein